MTPVVVNGKTIKYYRTANKWLCFFPNPFGPTWKYILAEDCAVQTPIRPAKDILLEEGPPANRRTLAKIRTDGILYIYATYAWDGASGPSIDTDTIMRGSLVHDVLFQMMRKGLLAVSHYKEIADRLLQAICMEDGMCSFRAWYVYQGVHLFGGGACKPGKDAYDEIVTN